MKEKTKLLTEYRIAASMLYFNEKSNMNQWIAINERSLYLLDQERQIKGLGIRFEYDIIGISFKKPNTVLIEEFYAKLGLTNNYTWSIKSPESLVVLLRVNDLSPSLHLGDKKLKKPIAESISLCDRSGWPLLIENQQRENLLTNPITSNDPPHEIPYRQFLAILNEIVNVEEFIEKAEELEIKKRESNEKDRIETPLLPYGLFAKLPSLIKSYIEQFRLPREKDISLLSLLVVLSSVIPNVISRHRNKKIWAHLYLVVTAPPASGKGVIADAIKVILKIEKDFRDKYDQELKEYKYEYSRFKAKEIEDEPIRPILRTIQLPTDTSFIALFEQLVANDGSGLMLETEIDSFVNAGKQEWGNYSLLNRKATHHEPHLLDRKGFEKPLFVESPKIAMVMGGTPNQFFSLFKSSEDGLFSRFLVYCYQLKQINLLNPFTNDNVDYFDTIVEDSSNIVYSLYQCLSQLKKEVEFQWTPDQSNRLFEHFNKTLENAGELFGDNSNSIILRHMLAATRLGMVLTTIEEFEKGNLLNKTLIVPGDHVVEIVMDIIKTCSQHSLLMLENINANSKSKPMDMKSHNMLRFLNSLPEGRLFKTKEAIQLGRSIKISERSVGDYLSSLCKSRHLEQTGYGEYRRSK